MFNPLSDQNYERLAALIQEHSGIRMPAVKRTMVEGRLRKRVRALGLATLNEYCDHLFEGGGLDREFTFLVDCITTNKTDFFREPDHFNFLCEEAVPHILENRPRSQQRPLKVWSAASSIGAEAYTMAMVLADLSARTSRFPFKILGTDICTEVLETARNAVYPEDMISAIPPDFQRRFVMRSRNKDNPSSRIVPELRRLVNFAQLNLMSGKYPIDHDVDIIFCRNILIYFDRETQTNVLTRLSRHLAPGGYLFLGHSESMAGAGLPLVQIAPSIYRQV